jgi:hypothetical protein
MSPVGFEPAIPANERPPQTHALNRAATGSNKMGQNFIIEKLKIRQEVNMFNLKENK